MTDLERDIIRKAFAYDLLTLLDKNPDKTYTIEEIEILMKACIAKQ